jgi:hypothetical protein
VLFFVESDLAFVPETFAQSVMNRISRRDLHDHIFVAIKCAPPLVIAGLRGKLPSENDKACDALTELVLRIMDREHRGVFDWSPPPENLFPKMA